MRRLDSVRADLGILRTLLRGMPRHATHAQQLQAFYGPQADRYDAFRERLLKGRREMIQRLDLPDAAHVVELGGGTGRNLDFFSAEQWQCISRFDVVDLCPALLQRARSRADCDARIHLIPADAARWHPATAVDCVYFSYALSMIPDWMGALRNAVAILKPGGLLGVVDFYVSPAKPLPGLQHHNWIARQFWPRWFGHDGVHLDPAHVPALCSTLPDHQLTSYRSNLPYVPLLQAPYYCFIGRKPLH